MFPTATTSEHTPQSGRLPGSESGCPGQTGRSTAADAEALHQRTHDVDSTQHERRRQSNYDSAQFSFKPAVSHRHQERHQEGRRRRRDDTRQPAQAICRRAVAIFETSYSRSEPWEIMMMMIITKGTNRCIASSCTESKVLDLFAEGPFELGCKHHAVLPLNLPWNYIVLVFNAL